MTDTKTTPTVPFQLGAILKLCFSVTIVLLACSLSWEAWPAAGSLMAVVLAALACGRVRFAVLLRRLALFLPIMTLVALSIPLSQGFNPTWLKIAATVLMRGLISFLSGLWLIQVLPFDNLLLTMRTLRIPAVVVACLAMMHRYLFVLWEETDRIRTARRARRLGRVSRVADWTAAIGLIGTLIIRSLDRGNRIHRAMLARGWDGHLRPWH